MKFIKLVAIILTGTSIGCSNIDLSKSMQSIGLGAPDDPKKILNPRALDKKNYSVFTGKWELESTADTNPKDKVVVLYEIAANGDGKITSILGENSQICTGRVKILITDSTKFSLTNSRLTCNDGQWRSPTSYSCVVKENQYEAACNHYCVRASDLSVQNCVRNFSKSTKVVPKL
jgi:hypothetical protein